MRTTLNIDDPILEELKRLQKRERKSLGRLVSDLLAKALKEHGEEPAEFSWTVREMGARYDLSDTESLLDAMDSKHPKR